MRTLHNIFSIQSPPGWFARVTIEDLQLTPNALNRCYHWLEIQYNLPGQPGVRYVCCDGLYTDRFSN